VNKISRPLSSVVIALFFLTIPMVNINDHKYSRSDEGVIEWDVKSYYAYLPAAFIYHDLSLGFVNTNPEYFNKWIWPIITPTGKKAILTTMGLSVLYTPFFLIGHAVAAISPKYLADGYSYPYHVALQFGAYIYFLISLLILRKILLKYFDDKITALTLLALGAGTNLFFYVSYNACMPHAYNFFLIVLFIYYLEKWTAKISFKTTILLGLIGGLIALIRPTNIVVLLLIPLWQVGSWTDFKEKVNVLFSNWYHVLLMAAAFVLVWVPQFTYWKHVSGQFFYFSYGVRNDRFYFDNPQIWKILFSYEKGWFVYTPLMLVAIFGLYSLYKKKIKLTLPIAIYLSVMVYVLSSWWCWWYGGSFGQRSMVDFYGLMAIPLAALIDAGLKKKWLKYGTIVLLTLLIAFNQFNIKQYRNMAISYWWMNKEGYWENFLKVRPTCKYWSVAMHPNYEKARLGIYEPVAPFNKNAAITDEMLINQIKNQELRNKPLIDSLFASSPSQGKDTLTILSNYAKEKVASHTASVYFEELKLAYYIKTIRSCKSWMEELEAKAKKQKISIDQMIEIEAKRIFTQYGEKYDKQ
jgi:hypothetical protein